MGPEPGPPRSTPGPGSDWADPTTSGRARSPRPFLHSPRLPSCHKEHLEPGSCEELQFRATGPAGTWQGGRACGWPPCSPCSQRASPCRPPAQGSPIPTRHDSSSWTPPCPLPCSRGSQARAQLPDDLWFPDRWALSPPDRLVEEHPQQGRRATAQSRRPRQAQGGHPRSHGRAWARLGFQGPPSVSWPFLSGPCPTSRGCPGCAGGQDGQGRGCQWGRDQTTEGVRGMHTPDTTVLPQTQPSRGLEGGACIGARRVGPDRWGQKCGRRAPVCGPAGPRLVPPKSPRVDKPGQMQPCVRAAVVPRLSARLSHAGLLSPAAAGPARQLPGNLCPTKKTSTETQPSRRSGLIRPHGVLSPALRARPA